jgi:hypothetical protein
MSLTIRNLRLAAPLVAVALLVPWPSSAQGLAQCRKITDDKERLACFDRTAEAPAAPAQTPPEAPIAAPAPAPAAKPVPANPIASFGLGEPAETKPEDFGRSTLPPAAPPPAHAAEEPAPIKEITAKILQVIDPYGKPRFVLDNKQVWGAVSYIRVTLPPTGDNTATIESSFVGYLMRVNDSVAEFNVRRLQ